MEPLAILAIIVAGLALGLILVRLLHWAAVDPLDPDPRDSRE